MTDPAGRIRISLGDGTLEVEGSADFVNQYAGAITAMLDRLKEGPVPNGGKARLQEAPASPQRGSIEMGEFGEVIHRLPRGAAGTDQILVAGYYASRDRADNTFTTAEASKLLVDQGIKLSNPSQSLKNNIGSKKVFKSGKGYKVSKAGEDHVVAILRT